MSNIKCGSCSKLGFDKLDNDYFCTVNSSEFESDDATCKDYVDGRGKINTVSSSEMITLVTISGGTITSLFTFTPNADGVKAVESKFAEKIQAYEDDHVDSEDISMYIEDGYYESDDGSIEIYIYWSDTTIVEVKDN